MCISKVTDGIVIKKNYLDTIKIYEIEQKNGVMGESNPRPPAPKAGIIPLDQSPILNILRFFIYLNGFFRYSKIFSYYMIII